MLLYKKYLKIFLAILVFMIAFTSEDLIAQQIIGGKVVKRGIWNNKEVEYADGQIALKLKSGVQMQSVIPLINKLNATIVENFDKLRWALLELPTGTDIFSVITALMNNPMIEAVEPNMMAQTTFNPNDPSFQDGHQWALRNIGQNPPGGTNDADIDAPEAWNITQGNSNIIIGILDSGIPMLSGSLSHPDLDDLNKIILGNDYTNDGEGVRDLLGHGTHVAGIVSAETNNSTGIAGVAGDCKILVVQVFNASGYLWWSWFKNGVIYAVDNGAKIINFSGAGGASQEAYDAVAYADSHNVLLVASAGNNCGARVFYPAAYSSSFPNVIAVSATDHNDVISEYSSVGPQVNVAAPGGYGTANFCETEDIYNDADDIYSTTPNYSFNLQNLHPEVTQNYGYLAGSSMAAPHVSGVAGLVLSLNPNLIPSQVRNILQQTADKVAGMGGQNFTNDYGYGRINAYKAIQPPTAPQNLTYTIVSNHPLLSWNANTEFDVVRYDIYRDLGDGSTKIGSSTTTSYNDYDLYISSSNPYFAFYYVTAVDLTNLESSGSNILRVWYNGLQKERSEIAQLPKDPTLYQNYPNPFNPITIVKYSLPVEQFVSIKLYNSLGQEISTIVEGVKQEGFYQESFNASKLPSGIYFYKMITGTTIQTQKMILQK